MANKITRSAKGQHCTVRLPGVCNGNPETVVLAHGNGSAYDKGIGAKSRDWQAAYSCSACHDVVDRRRSTDLTRDQVELYFAHGVMRTQRILETKGLLVVA